jgi:hypothetical protein
MWACRRGEGRIPDDHVRVEGLFKLADSGETVDLFKEDEQVGRIREIQKEIQNLNNTCDELAKNLGLETVEDEAHRSANLIQQLHEYNEAKDLAQALIGKLAVLQNCTTKGLYPQFELELDD